MRVDVLKPELKLAEVATSPDLTAPIKLPQKQLMVGLTILGLWDRPHGPHIQNPLPGHVVVQL
jgi:hypothetical protein